jgi:hypothetical protein
MPEDEELPIQVFRCLPCSKRKINPITTTATTFCNNCNKAFCDPCIAAHDAVVDDHTTKPLATARPSNNTGPIAQPPPPNNNNLKCQHHPARDIEAYCTADNSLV